MAAKIVSVDGGGRPTDSLGRGGSGRGRRRRAVAAVAALLVVLGVLVPTGTGAQSVSDESDASLSSLSLSGADLGFDAEETAYWVAYGAAVEYPTVSAVAAQAGASVSISPTDVDIVASGHQAEVLAFWPVRVTVTSPDGTATRTYSLWLFDFRLQSLGVEGHDIGFDPMVTDYALEVPSGTEQVTLTADASSHTFTHSAPDADPDTDGHQVGLDAGDNTITVTATPRSRIILAPQTYTITITRPPLALEANQNNEEELVVLDNDPPVEDADASLSSLELTGATLDFDPATLSYDVDFVAAADHATITATAAHPDATVSSLSVDDDENTEGHQIAITSSGTTTATVTVTASDTTTQTYQLNITDTRLRGLGIDGYDIGFDPATASYTLSVPNSVDEVTVGTGTETNTKLNIAYSPTTDADDNAEGHQVDLAVGANTITATATLTGGTDTQTYTITITRDADASLSSLELTGATLGFDAATLSYDVDFVAAADHATITAEANDSGATVEITPTDADENTEGHQIAITSSGTTAATVTVTASDTTTQTYQLNITDTRLRGLGIDGYNIGFDPATASYTLSVPNSVDEVTVGTGTETNTKLNISYSPTTDADDNAEGHQVDLDVGANTITATATLTGGTDAQTYTITVTRQPLALEANQNNEEGLVVLDNDPPVADDDASLSSLELTGTTLDFDAATLSYDVDFVAAADQATITAEANDAGATVEITPTDADDNTDGHQIAITNGGTTTATVTVTASDTTTQTYQLNITDTRLRGIAVSGTNLVFDSATSEYAVKAAPETSVVTVVPHPQSTSALDISYSPATDADDNADGHQVDLAEGANTITVTATLKGGTDAATYTIIVTRVSASGDARLASAGITPGFLAFNRNLRSHTAYVLPSTELVTVTAESVQSDATVEFSPTDADLNAEGHQIATTDDTVTVTVTVTASDDTTTTHTITVKHRPGGFVKIDVGWASACALHLTGRVACWGNEETGARPEPVVSPPANARYIDIAAARASLCGVLADGTGHCWSSRARGNFTLPGSDNFAVSSNGSFTKCWMNINGYVNCSGGAARSTSTESVPDYVAARRYQAIDTMSDGVCALGLDNKIDCWRGTRYLNSPSGKFKTVAAGGRSGCGILQTGNLKCWKYTRAPYNSYSEFGPEPGTFTHVSLGYWRVCGVKTDNTPHCWRTPESSNDYLIPPTGVEFESMRVGFWYFVCGLTTEGEINCFSQQPHENALVADGLDVPGIDDEMERQEFALHLRGIHLGFDSSVTQYNVTAGYRMDQTDLILVNEHAYSSVDISPDDADSDTPGHQIDFSNGSATVTVTVTGEGGSDTAYTIGITRDAAPDDEARLRSLSISDVELDFDDDTYLYRADVEADVASVTVTPTAYDTDATVVVLPADADLNAEGHQVSLTAGQANFITISVMSEDTTEVATYTIVINRPDS